jgi:small subunit ribosomal protein S6
MKSYEGLFVFPPESTPDVRKNQLKSLDDLFAKFKAQVQQKNEWGRKPLGYPIRKYSDGHMLVYDFQMDPSQATEFRKALQLQEDLIKFMVILKPVVKIDKKAVAKAAAAAAAPATPATPASSPRPAPSRTGA